MNTCPLCGSSLSTTGAPWQPGHSFDFAPPAASPPMTLTAGATYTRTTPTRTPTAQGDVLVPLAQAGITGGLVGLALGGLALAAGWPGWVPLAGGGGVLAISWLALLADHRALLRITETVTTEAERETPPPAPADTIRVDLHERTSATSDRWRWVDLPIDRAAFEAIARGVLAGRPLSERAWAGKGKPLSGPQFRTLQDELLKAGFVRWASTADNRQGVVLTRAGAELFRKAAGE